MGASVHRRMPGAPTIGVDVGGSKCLGVVLGDAAQVIAEHRLATPRRGGELLDAVGRLITGLATRAGSVGGIGIGVPGLVDQRGVLRFAPNLPGVTELPVGPAMSQRFGPVPVRVENDASCAGWAESQMGAASGGRNVLLATLGTGIGGGLVVDGRLVRGANGFAGEIGHMVIDPAGPACPCGQRGCWERFASGSGLARLGREAVEPGGASRILDLAGGDVGAIRAEHVTQAAAAGDMAARRLVERFARWLALGLANLANVLDPERIVLGGGMITSEEVILAPTAAAFHRLVEGAEHRPRIPIVAAVLGERAGAIGAALLARSSPSGI